MDAGSNPRNFRLIKGGLPEAKRLTPKQEESALKEEKTAEVVGLCTEASKTLKEEFRKSEFSSLRRSIVGIRDSELLFGSPSSANAPRFYEIAPGATVYGGYRGIVENLSSTTDFLLLDRIPGRFTALADERIEKSKRISMPNPTLDWANAALNDDVRSVRVALQKATSEAIDGIRHAESVDDIEKAIKAVGSAISEVMYEIMDKTMECNSDLYRR